MVHRYRLANSSKSDIKILELINRKTCCGSIRLVGNPLLGPGNGVDVEVSLVVGDKFGGVSHETEVVTDSPSEPNIVLRTTATAYAAFRIESASSSSELVVTSSSEPLKAEFRVFTAGTLAEPPADLDRVDLLSTNKVAWSSSKEESPSDIDGVSFESRRFSILLDPSGPLGDRRSEIVLQRGKDVVFSHIVIWVVAPTISAAPKVLVISPGRRSYPVLFESRDKSFLITRFECDVPGIQGKFLNTSASRKQMLKIEVDRKIDTKKGLVTIFTDHPSQAKLELPFVVLD